MDQKLPNLAHHKIFVLVDKTLSRSQQAVQCGHALLNFSSDFRGKHDWHEMSLVLLGVLPDEIVGWNDRLRTEMDASNNISMYASSFYEPYWNDRLTAIVAYGDEVEDIVKDLRLL
jgi:hypothetical protein